MTEIFELIDVLKDSEFFELDDQSDEVSQDMVTRAAFRAEYDLPEKFFDFFEVEALAA